MPGLPDHGAQPATLPPSFTQPGPSLFGWLAHVRVCQVIAAEAGVLAGAREPIVSDSALRALLFPGNAPAPDSERTQE